MKEWLENESAGVPGAEYARLTKTRRSELLGVPRTAEYRKHKKVDRGREELIMSRIDYHHTHMPYLGVRRLREKLREDDESRLKDGVQPMCAGRKLIKRLMEEMGIRAVFPGPNLSKRNLAHKVHPYLLRNIDIMFPNQVWSIDITYIKLGRGHMYLTAVIDWHSRYIVGWKLSDTLDATTCKDALADAIAKHGTPAIVNSDQGSQFTSEEYVSFLKDAGIRQSMDGRRRWADNVIVERWFRSFKTEWLYITEVNTPRELRIGIERYIAEYNCERPHQTYAYSTPAKIYGEAFRGTAA